MDDFTTVFLSRGKEELRDVDTSLSYTPFGTEQLKTDDINNSSTVSHQQCDDEPESVKKWRCEYNANIEKKDAQEAVKDKSMRQSAEKELSEWQTWYKKNLVKSHQDNRAHEEELQAQRDKTMLLSQSVAKVNPSEAVIWERVCQLCDLTVSTTGDGVIATKPSSVSKDVTRFRSLLLSLKNNPPRVSH